MGCSFIFRRKRNKESIFRLAYLPAAIGRMVTLLPISSKYALFLLFNSSFGFLFRSLERGLKVKILYASIAFIRDWKC